MTSSFVIVDESTGGAYTASELAHAAAVLEEQLNAHVAAEWGGSYAVRVGALSSVQPGECVARIQDTLPDPNAAGYHDVLNGAAVVYIAAGVSLDYLTCTLSHEFIETAVDPGANRWADDTDGTQKALEACDAVESFSYTIDGVMVSDFCLQSFFCPGAPGPYSYMKKPSAPFMTVGADGGDYQLVRSIAGDEKQVTAQGKIADHRRARKAHPTSRAYKRGLRL